MKPIRGEVWRVDCARDRRGAARRPETSIAAKARRVGRAVMMSPPCGGPQWAPRASAAVATLHGQLLAGTHRAELRPERLVDLLESGNGAGRPVAAERTRAAVVGGVGGGAEGQRLHELVAGVEEQITKLIALRLREVLGELFHHGGKEGIPLAPVHVAARGGGDLGQPRIARGSRR